MDYTQEYSSTWRLMRVDPDTWADVEAVPGLDSASISRDCTDDYPLLETGSFSFTWDPAEDFPDGWYRLEMIAKGSDGGTELVPVATELLEISSGLIDYGVDTIDVSGQSVLKYADDKLMLDVRHIAKGANGALYVRDLLREVLPLGCPVRVIGSGFTVDEHYVFDPDMSYLQAAWDVLRLGSWCMQVPGDGSVQIVKKPDPDSDDAKFRLSRDTEAFLLPGVNWTYDRNGVPNCYVAEDAYGNRVRIENRQSGSKTSYSARGRWIDAYDTSPVPIDGEGLDGYARRKLEEESTVSKAYSYTREFVEDLLPFDLVSASLTGLGITGDLRILSQTLTCGHGLTVTEKAALEIKEYRR